MRRAACVLVAVGMLVTLAERTGAACTSPCPLATLPAEGKTLPAGVTGLPMIGLMGSTTGIELRRGGTVVEARVENYGTLVPSEPLSAGAYELTYAQPSCTYTNQVSTATFTVGEARPRPLTTGTMRARTYVVSKKREPTSQDLNRQCGIGPDPRETYDRVVAEITLEIAPELVPYLPVTLVERSVASPRDPANTAFSGGMTVTNPVYTINEEIRCDELRSKGESEPGKYTYSYAARLAGETTALPPASVTFDFLCPASAKTPVYDASGQPIPQPDDEGCSVGPRGAKSASGFGAVLFAACALGVLRKRRAR